MTKQPEGRPSLKPGCRLSPIGDVLLIPEGALRLQGPSASILRACDGSKTLDEVLDQLLDQFPNADRAKVSDETAAFLLRLVERGAIEFL